MFTPGIVITIIRVAFSIMIIIVAMFIIVVIAIIIIIYASSLPVDLSRVAKVQQFDVYQEFLFLKQPIFVLELRQ